MHSRCRISDVTTIRLRTNFRNGPSVSTLGGKGTKNEELRQRRKVPENGTSFLIRSMENHGDLVITWSGGWQRSDLGSKRRHRKEDGWFFAIPCHFRRLVALGDALIPQKGHRAAHGVGFLFVLVPELGGGEILLAIPVQS